MPKQLSPTSPLPLSAKEKAVLEFIQGFQTSSGISPSFQEIKENFGFASFNSVQNYLKQLTAKGYIKIPSNQKRAIQVLQQASSLKKHSVTSAGSSHQPLLQSNEEVLLLPLQGKVAAGRPIEALSYNESVAVPSHMVRHASKTFALKVQGDSMIDEGILDGDTILVQQQSSANNGDIVVATIENEATVKRFYLRTPPRGSHDHLMVELRPANEKLESMWFSPYEVSIQGIVVGLLRKFL
jgi:repressor LexA